MSKFDALKIKSAAFVSRCQRYRYWLTRTWNDELPRAGFIMLNPSVADARKDDPTIKRCVAFAKSWGCGSVMVVNLFAYRATNPKALKTCHDPVGPENDYHVGLAVLTGQPLVAAWGANVPKDMGHRIDKVLELVDYADAPLMCLGHTAEGHPRHPLYVAGSTELVPFEPDRKRS